MEVDVNSNIAVNKPTFSKNDNVKDEINNTQNQRQSSEYVSSDASAAYRAYASAQVDNNPYKNVSDEGLFKKMEEISDTNFEERHNIIEELVKNRGYFYANDGKHGFVNLDKTDIEDLEYVRDNGFLNKKIKNKLTDAINTRWAEQVVGIGGGVTYPVIAKDGHKATIMKDPDSKDGAIIITNFDDNGVASSDLIHAYPEDVSKYL